MQLISSESYCLSLVASDAGEAKEWRWECHSRLRLSSLTTEPSSLFLVLFGVCCTFCHYYMQGKERIYALLYSYRSQKCRNYREVNVDLNLEVFSTDFNIQQWIKGAS